MIDQNKIDLWWELVKTSFKMRYQNSILGFLWVLIKPYTMFIVMYLIFSHIVRDNVENYALYLLTGVIFFSFVNELLLLGQMSLLERANIILKVNFPRYIAIISALTGAVINLCINMLLIVGIALYIGIKVQFVGVIYLFFVIITVFVWALGIAFLTSILTVRLRDLKNIVELGMFVMQYATPIFYSFDGGFISNKSIINILKLNPIGYLMNQFRASVGIYGTREYLVVLIIFLLGLVFTLVSYNFFTKKSKKIAEYF